MTTAGRRPRGLTRGANVVVLAPAIEYVIVQQLSGIRRSVGLVGQVWLPVFLLVVVPEAAALVS
ncbi:hypothetical protein BLA60_15030 [Actinophytocola xinjiangensis]|uniref:Uncharacterized protein n=1 Tax=Actinophytocola xinjiangensis TaxID=485602 RepID=A0A7Z1AZB6_9PSEU|nr:hypothetical protein [Actinophytocola xinjiangensis]OLF10502.1 hypothetical protein BLA60_15030 [Actinophytocola xinjiangensis]